MCVKVHKIKGDKMGMSLFSSTSEDCCKKTDTTPEPNPFDFEILEEYEADRAIALKVRYPHATEYNGIKILVYAIIHKGWIYDTKKLDPHFLEGEISPIARFRGDDLGWTLAKSMIIN